jgi:hypothetical protein
MAAAHHCHDVRLVLLHYELAFRFWELRTGRRAPGCNELTLGTNVAGQPCIPFLDRVIRRVPQLHEQRDNGIQNDPFCGKQFSHVANELLGRDAVACFVFLLKDRDRKLPFGSSFHQAIDFWAIHCRTFSWMACATVFPRQPGA